MAVTCPALEKVSQQLVTNSNPARDDLEAMDSHRCAALHNAIYEHGWTSAFGDTADFLANTETWWEAFATPGFGTADMHSSVQEFLKEARVLRDRQEQDKNFFYFMSGLSHSNMLDGEKDWFDIGHPKRLMTLYETYFSFATKLDGLVYDQLKQKAITHFDITDDLEFEPEQPWRPLETILTFWIDLIRREKVIAVSPELSQPRIEWRPIPGTQSEGMQELPQHHHVTGDVLKLDDHAPWAMQPWSQIDLDETLSLPTKEAFIDQPARDEPRPNWIVPEKNIDYPEHVFPILLFRHKTSSQTSADPFQSPWTQHILTNGVVGLYLDACDRSNRVAYEDGFRLVLPFAFDRFGPGWAARGDGSQVIGYDELFQSGVNPFNDSHPPKLVAFLSFAYHKVASSAWSVDEHGVAGGIDVWKEANTEESWQEYWLPAEYIGFQ
ncbi:hypothetical protein LTR78_008540 [Recurvomyces mirabilis]|uniref:Uncharacterized protein n=1 Tax=Recurvomyces mirabilis TaxID=574656 RepID=A0AAE0TQ06_9PEZI|nr:hypothetical protein LTR78_008540 [Recurvomyces mirabilis]KAK5156291.1 hypothetical protein LTS14_005179 [Recurvomyces mirabilis]